MNQIEFVYYARPKSAAFGHTVKGTTIKNAWEKVQNFLTKMTIPELRTVPILECWPNSYWVDPYIAQQCHAEVVEILGAPIPEGDNVGKWVFDVNNLDHAFEACFLNEKYPKQKNGPVELKFSYRFLWKDPKSGEKVDGQEQLRIFHSGGYHSSLNVYISNKVFVQPIFVIPFKMETDEFLAFKNRLVKELPFELVEKDLTRAVTKKSGIGFKAIKNT